MLATRRNLSLLLRPGTATATAATAAAAAASGGAHRRRANSAATTASSASSSSQSSRLSPSSPSSFPRAFRSLTPAALSSRRPASLPGRKAASTRRQSLQGAPSLVDDDNENPSTSSKKRRPPAPPPLAPPPPPRWAKAALVSLSSLPLAISELALIAALSAVGTVIEQNKGIDYYQASYPVGAPGLGGLLDFRVITFLGWDHVYSSLPFLGLCALLAASLAACTSTRQAPALRVAQAWRFARSANGVYVHARGARKQGAFAAASVLPSARARDLGRILASKGYQVFVCDNDDEDGENENENKKKKKMDKKGGGGRGGSSSSSASSASSSSSSSSSPSSSSSSVSLYAFKGLAGKVGPIVVHASLLLTIGGAAAGALGGWRGNALVPVGGEFLVSRAISPASPVSLLPSGARSLLRVDGVNVVYRDDGSVAQFESDLSVLDPATGVATKSQRISVNKPLRFGGVTAYQADYGMAALTVRVAAASPESVARAAAAAAAPAAAGGEINPDGSLKAPSSSPSPSPSSSSSSSSSTSAALVAQPFNLPFAEIQDAGGIKGRAWATFLPTGPGGGGGGGGASVNGGGREASGGGGGSDGKVSSSSSTSTSTTTATAPKGITLLARDFQTVVAYDSKGAFAGVRRPGSGKPLTVEGVDVVVDDIVGSSGVELKADPGVPVVYAGFAGLMVSTLVSYLSHSQVWAWEEEEEEEENGEGNGGRRRSRKLHVAGRTNRAALGFEQELERALAEVPEVP